MAKSEKKSDHEQPPLPQYYVIEMTGDNGPVFVICQPVAVLDETQQRTITPHDLRSYIKDNQVPAAPLPGETYEAFARRVGGPPSH